MARATADREWLPIDEYVDKVVRKEHPEYFDKDGTLLPSAISGYSPGKWVTTGNADHYGPKMEIASDWKPSILEPFPRIRCTHVSPWGNRCRRNAISGGFICEDHGGKGRRVVEKAKEINELARKRLFEMVDPALDVIDYLVKSEGTNDAIRLKAAQDVLDRAGMKSATEINVHSEQHTVDWTAVITEKLSRLKEPPAVESEMTVLEIEEVGEEDAGN